MLVCKHCGEPVGFDAVYLLGPRNIRSMKYEQSVNSYISHINIEAIVSPEDGSLMVFHVHCFQEVAGERYMP